MNPIKAFDKLAGRYGEVYGQNHDYHYFLEQFLDAVRKGRVLDAGCGSGVPITSYLVKHGYDVLGIDASKKMIEAAKKNVPGAEFMHADLKKVDLEPDSFDGAVVFFSLTHMKKKEAPRVIKRIHEALKEDGAMLLGVREGTAEGNGVILGQATYISHYTEDELRIMLSDFNVELLERRAFKLEPEESHSHVYILATKKRQEPESFAESSDLELEISPTVELQPAAGPEEESPDENEAEESGPEEDGRPEFISVDDLKQLAESRQNSKYLSLEDLKKIVEHVESKSTRKEPKKSEKSDGDSLGIKITFFGKKKK